MPLIDAEFLSQREFWHRDIKVLLILPSSHSEQWTDHQTYTLSYLCHRTCCSFCLECLYSPYVCLANIYSSLQFQFKCHFLSEALCGFTYSGHEGMQWCGGFPLITHLGSQSDSCVEESYFFHIYLFPEPTVSTVTIEGFYSVLVIELRTW